MLYEITDTRNVSSLFGKWEETLIWSCLQGVMGKIYADELIPEMNTDAKDSPMYVGQS